MIPYIIIGSVAILLLIFLIGILPIIETATLNKELKKLSAKHDGIKQVEITTKTFDEYNYTNQIGNYTVTGNGLVVEKSSNYFNSIKLTDAGNNIRDYQNVVEMIITFKDGYISHYHEVKCD